MIFYQIHSTYSLWDEFADKLKCVPHKSPTMHFDNHLDRIPDPVQLNFATRH